MASITIQHSLLERRALYERHLPSLCDCGNGPKLFLGLPSQAIKCRRVATEESEAVQKLIQRDFFKLLFVVQPRRSLTAMHFSCDTLRRDDSLHLPSQVSRAADQHPIAFEGDGHGCGSH